MAGEATHPEGVEEEQLLFRMLQAAVVVVEEAEDTGLRATVTVVTGVLMEMQDIRALLSNVAQQHQGVVLTVQIL